MELLKELVLTSAAGFSVAASVRLFRKREIFLGLVFMALSVGATNLALSMSSPGLLTWLAGAVIGLVLVEELS